MLWSNQPKMSFFFFVYMQSDTCGTNPALYPEYTVLTIKQGGASIMLWGDFSSIRNFKLLRVYGKMGGAKYLDILGENLPEATQKLRLGWRFTL